MDDPELIFFFVVIPAILAALSVLGWVIVRFRHVRGLGLLATLIDLLAWALAGTALLVLTTLALAVFIPIFTVFAPAVALLFLLVLARAVRQARRRRASAVLGYLEQALRLNLPLTDTLGAAERSERGRLRGRLGKLRSALADGLPLAEALGRCVPEVPWSTRRVIGAAERVGRLPAVLTRLHRRRLREMQQRAQDPVLGGVYGVVMVCIVLTLFGAVNLLILPKYIEIFDDFGVEMPWITIVTFEAHRWLAWWPMVAAGLLFLAMVGVLMRTLARNDTNEPADRGVVDPVAWRTPGWGAAVRARSWATAHELAGEALRAGCALPEALREAGAAASSRVAQRRLERMAERVEEGEAIGDAARSAGLRAIDRGVLGAAAGSGELPEAFSFLSRYHAARFSRTAAVARAAVLPLVTLLIAFLVAWITVSLFSPLVTLIESLTPAWEVM